MEGGAAEARWACSLCADQFETETDAARHACVYMDGANGFKDGYQSEMTFDIRDNQWFDYESEEAASSSDEASSAPNSVDGGPPAKRYKTDVPVAVKRSPPPVHVPQVGTL